MRKIITFPILLLGFILVGACNPDGNEPLLADPPEYSDNNTGVSNDDTDGNNNKEDDNIGGDNNKGDNNKGDNNTEDNNNNTEDNSNMEENIIKLTVNDRTFTATLVENSSTKALIDQLAKEDIVVRMDDYGDMEKVGSLGFSLPRNDVRTITSPGDIILYQGNYLVIYYDTNSWNFTKLGRVDDVTSRDEMLELLGGKGDVTVKLSLD